MNIPEIIILIVGTAYIFVRGKVELHMMQLNSYMNHRYFRWLITKNIKTSSFYIDVVVVSCSLLITFFGMKLLSNAGFSVYLGYSIVTLVSKKEKKKLIFTPRAIRLYISLILVSFVYGYVSIKIFSLDTLLYYCIPTTPLIIIMILLIANAIIYPLEEIIKTWYINDAKKKLRSLPGLIRIGITGSFGKTSTKYFLKNILNQSYNTLATPESYNTTMGVVKTIRAYLKPTDEILIAEMGAKRKNDIQELCEIISPKYGIITAIGEQHLESFGTVDNILKTKFELQEKLESGGILMINKDYPIVSSMMKRNDISVYYYSIEDTDADFNVRNIKYSTKGISFDVYDENKYIANLETKLVGKYNVSNILGAVALAYLLKIPIDDIKFAVKKLESVPHRLEIKVNAFGITIIDDTFNSNPVGARMALDVLKQLEGNKKIIITPGMVELGDKEAEENFNFGQEIAEICNLVILVGANQTRKIKDGLISKKFDEEKIYTVSSVNESKLVLKEKIERGDVILYENDLPDTYNN